MTHVTTQALNRKFENKNLRRDKIIPALNLKKIGMCPHCDLPVLSSVGQIHKKTDRGFYTHKICKKNSMKYY